ncbi:MAG: hypothetical protein H7Y43_18015 [Akkermansiaceae bacterium]|nr:hypothetical protein [Verrucomicrobiales bacterium]
MNPKLAEQPYPERESNAPDVLREAISRPQRVERDFPSPEQIVIYRRMTPGRRLEVAEQLFWSGRKMKGAWLKAQHPDWTEEKIEAEVKRVFSHARS